MSAKIVSVLGATGAQGSSVVDALLKNPAYAVRALTRNPNSDKAKALAAKGAEVVQANADDVDSLTAAFRGSYAVFAMTDFFEPFSRFNFDTAKAMEVEVQQGVNLANAAAATPTLQHYVWSTLPNATKISGGKYLIPHFEAKNKIDAYIKAQPALFAKTTFLWVTFFASNLDFPMYTPYYIPTGQKYIQIQSTPADTPVDSIGDVRANLGPIVQSILEQPGKTHARIVHAYVEKTTAGELLQAWADAQGTKAQYLQVDRDSFNALWPGWSEEMGNMMEFWDWAREKSWTGDDEIVTVQDLGVKNLLGVKESMAHLVY